jgi:hypothetical protein
MHLPKASLAMARYAARARAYALRHIQPTLRLTLATPHSSIAE